MTNRFLHIAPIVIKYSLFVIFAAFLLKQCMLYDKYFGETEIDAGTLLMPLFIAGFVLISKRYWWIIPVFAVTTIWSIANLMYFAFFYQLLDCFFTIHLFIPHYYYTIIHLESKQLLIY